MTYHQLKQTCLTWKEEKLNFYKILLAVLMLSFVVSTAQAIESNSTKAIVGATLVDIYEGTHTEDVVILIEGERITAVGKAGNVEIPATAEIIDAKGLWLIPGMMNMHVHLGLKLPGKVAAELANETEGELTLRMAASVREILQAGVTTIRLPGNSWPPVTPKHSGISLHRAISKGQAHGPRIFSAGEALVITGGHGSTKGQTHHDGPYELMKAARKEISDGASWVKIMISGGIATEGGGIAKALMTPDEINAVVDVAHRFGAKVAAHSGSPEATNLAIDAGIDSIEHGYFLNRKVLRKMKKHGTWLVPTIVVSQPASHSFFEKIGSPDWYLERRVSVGKEHWKALQIAIEEGVNIALGTDQSPSEPNDGTTATAREAQYYVEAGMTPLQALRAATIEPAKMLAADDQLGTIETGKFADIVGLNEDPGLDIKALRNIQLVMKGGKVYRNKIGK